MSSQSQKTEDLTDLGQKIRNLDVLPPFPAMASRILMECQKPDVDTRTVAQLIECEPAICSKLIQMANSPMFGASSPIGSISHAIVLLGFKTVSQMAISIATGSLFDHGDPSLAKHRRQTFRQSLACAVTSRVLAEEIKANPNEAFLGGVVHDVGKLVFFEVAPSQFCEMLESEKSGNTTTLEMEAFGIDHAEVGKRCGANWGFPANINRAIKFHHSIPSEESRALSIAIMAGNYYSQHWDLASNPGIAPPTISAIEDLFENAQLAEAKDICFDQYESIVEICSA